MFNIDHIRQFATGAFMLHYLAIFLISLILGGCVASQTPPYDPIEAARARHTQDALSCIKTHFPQVDFRKSLTSEEENILHSCLEERGWEIMTIRGATFLCHSIQSPTKGALITFCP